MWSIVSNCTLIVALWRNAITKEASIGDIPKCWPLADVTRAFFQEFTDNGSSHQQLCRTKISQKAHTTSTQVTTETRNVKVTDRFVFIVTRVAQCSTLKD
jgi:hypothetical protein